VLVIQDYTLYYLQFLKTSSYLNLCTLFTAASQDCPFHMKFQTFVLELKTLNTCIKINFYVKEVQSADE